MSASKSLDCAALLAQDGYLRPYLPVIEARYKHFCQLLSSLPNGNLEEFTRPGQRGFCETSSGLWFREWAPSARTVHLIGDFNGWNRTSHALNRREDGVWEIFFARLDDGRLPILHCSRVKLALSVPSDVPGCEPGAHVQVDRIPSHATFAVCGRDYAAFLRRESDADPDVASFAATLSNFESNSTLMEAVFWRPRNSYVWRHTAPRIPDVSKGDTLLIYEAHVGIASDDPRVATYREFADNVIPRIAYAGYNAVQLMAVMEHAYYASFGYQVTSFFAPSSRFGTPEDLKYLVDTAHGAGILVLMDVVHSHASKNVLDGLNRFDGTDGGTYFHGGCRGTHALWDSRLFDYGREEVLRFLLGNLRMWAESFCFDGFRFDGVTSMLYHHHGVAYGFTGHYDEYFAGGHVDGDALAYLQLANTLLHTLIPGRPLLTIAEDVSGMPLLCRPTEREGGAGFDYRLAMALPDLWVGLMRAGPQDEAWPVRAITQALTNRRHGERTVAYAECHDQALVGDKTLAHWLMDAELYTGMSLAHGPASLRIDRGIALHKLMRTASLFLGGDAYLCFMGNEFGHPEWLDFPRAGNGWSFAHARRQFSLADNPKLRYAQLGVFDAAMLASYKSVRRPNPSEDCTNKINENQISEPNIPCSRDKIDLRVNYLRFDITRVEDDEVHGRIIVAQTDAAVLAVNWHPTRSHAGWTLGVRYAGTYRVALDTDETRFGGHGRIDHSCVYKSTQGVWDGMAHHITIYLPSRTALLITRNLVSDPMS